MGSSKTLTGVKGPFRMVAMGQSFHWMDEKAVLKRFYDLLGIGGGVVIVGRVNKCGKIPERPKKTKL